MTRPWILALLVALCCAGCSAGYGRSYYGFEADIGGAPAPPSIALDAEPNMVVVTGTDVYEVDADLGYDMFRYGPTWYVSYQGYWYSAPSYRGPFTLIRARSVPRRIYDVPVERWHHHPADHRRSPNGDRDHHDDHRGN